jgi:CBS domain-containing protein
MTAFQTMQEHGVGRLPGLDDRNELAGLGSRSDLVTALNVIQTGGTPSVLRQRSFLEDDRPL